MSFNQTIEVIMQMDFSAREQLLEIIRKRQIEERRQEIADNARDAKVLLKKGMLKGESALKIIAKLNDL